MGKSEDDGGKASGAESDEPARTVISFDDESDGEATEVIDASPTSRKRRIIVDDEDFDEPEDEDFDDFEDEEYEYEDEPDPPAPAEPKEPGFFDRLGVPTQQLALFAAGVVGALLLVSLFTVYAVASWTSLLPDPQVGQVGDKGLVGHEGPRGLRGPKGPRGHEGTKGPPGTVGPDGSDGIVIVNER